MLGEHRTQQLKKEGGGHEVREGNRRRNSLKKPIISGGGEARGELELGKETVTKKASPGRWGMVRGRRGATT